MSEEITVRDRIDELMKQHGGLRKAARALQLHASYLSRLRNGHQKNPSPEALRRMGLVKHITYVRRKPYERVR
jgi:hypothetical protein